MTVILALPVRPPLQFQVVYCSETLPCSDLLVCGEELTTRFYWNTL